jgi:hypothetical protein
MKWRFAGTFLTTFALLTFAYALTDFGAVYRVATLTGVQIVSPLLHGWFLEFDRPGLGYEAAFLRGQETLPMLLQIPALSMGLMPLISLIVATPGQSWTRAATAAVAGSAIYLFVDVVVIAIYPLFMDQRLGGAPQNFANMVKDTVGVFSGLVAFVVAPLAIWFVLTYPALRSVWRLGASAGPLRPPGN